MIKGLIADIERASNHDGPGLRTVVFLKGCPLNCEWCHNPECISFEVQTLYYPEKCINCGKCEQGCFSGAKVECGKYMTVEEVVAEVKRDINYYGKNGGLTISGGEPLMQPSFTKALAKACREEGINTAIETSLFLYDEQVLKEFDLIMFDLKFPDQERHIKYTGKPVDVIKENIKKASKLNIPMIARTPIITGVNFDVQTIKEISQFVYSFTSVIKYELLPYHPLGLSKAKALNITQKQFDVPSKAVMKELEKYAFVR